jgi:hypothetical protein
MRLFSSEEYALDHKTLGTTPNMAPPSVRKLEILNRSSFIKEIIYVSLSAET